MQQNNELNRGRSVVFSIHAHLVFVTKYRRACFDAEHLEFLRFTFSTVCRKQGATLIECNGEADHVHLLISYPPKLSISALVNSLKGVSSRMLSKEYGRLHKWYWKGVLWSPSYFVSSCGGAPLAVIKKYIECQQTPDPRLKAEAWS
jgi:putative transposase